MSNTASAQPRLHELHAELARRNDQLGGRTSRVDEWFKRFPNGGTVFVAPRVGDGEENEGK